MFPYWLLFSVSAAGAIGLGREQSQSHRSRGLIAVALLSLLLIGLRYHVGGDWGNYMEIFNYWSFYGLNDIVSFGDPAYSFLNWLAHQLNVGIWFVNSVCALCVVWGLTRFASSQPNPWLVYVVAVPYFVIVVAMGYTRQGAALGFILAGLAGIKDGKLPRFVIYAIIGAVFHKSAVVIIPLVLLAFAGRRIFTVLLVLIVLVLYYYFIFRATVDVFMTNYVQANYDSQGAAMRVGMNIIPALLFLIFPKRFADTTDEERVWRIFSLAALASLAMLVISPSSTAVDRIALYLIPLQLFVLARLPLAFSSTGRPNETLRAAVLIYSALVQFVWLNFASHAQDWLPYRFYPLGAEFLPD